MAMIVPVMTRWLVSALFLASTCHGFAFPKAATFTKSALFSSFEDVEDVAFANSEEANGAANSILESAYARHSPLDDASFNLNRREAVAASAALLSSPFLMQYAMSGGNPGMASLSDEAMLALEKGDTVVRNLWLGRLAYPTLIVALESGLFEALKDGKLSKDELGKRLDPPVPGSGHAMGSFTSVLSSLGLLQMDNGGRVALTEPAKMVLLKDSKYYWGHQLLAADGLTASLRRAVKLESLNSPATKKTAFQAHSDAATKSFIQSMQAHSGVTAEMTAAALQDVLGPSSANQASHILDMAGGSGCFSCALARSNPNLRVTLSDLPSVVALWWRENNGFSGQSKRIHSTPADLFDASSWPRGADVVLLANVIHDWGEEQSRQIMQAARSVLLERDDRNSKGRLVLIEQLLHDDLSGPLPAALASVSMLLGDWRTGKQYSFSELKALLLSAGFDGVELGPKCGNFHHSVIATVRG